MFNVDSGTNIQSVDSYVETCAKQTCEKVLLQVLHCFEQCKHIVQVSTCASLMH